MPADYVLAFLPVAFGAANQAGIQSGAVAVGLFDDHEAHGLPIRFQGEQMQVAVLHFRNRDAHDVIYGRHLARLHRRRVHLRINKISREREDYREAGRSRTHHPEALAAILGFHQAALRVRGGRLHGIG